MLKIYFKIRIINSESRYPNCSDTETPLGSGSLSQTWPNCGPPTCFCGPQLKIKKKNSKLALEIKSLASPALSEQILSELDSHPYLDTEAPGYQNFDSFYPNSDTKNPSI